MTDENKKLTPAERVRKALSQFDHSRDNETAREEIGAWLESEDLDYTAGLVLFGKYSRNRGLFYSLSRKEQPERLERELSKIFGQSGPVLETKQAVVLPVPELKAERLQIDWEGKINYEDLPENIKALYDLNTSDYKLMRAVHEKMKQVKTDAERAELRTQLENYDDAIAGRWTAIDNWAKTGGLPEPEPLNETGGILTAQEVQKHRTTISRRLKELEAGIEDEKAKKEAISDVLQAGNALLTGGQTIGKKTLPRIQAFYPEFGMTNNDGSGV